MQLCTCSTTGKKSINSFKSPRVASIFLPLLHLLAVLLRHAIQTRSFFSYSLFVYVFFQGRGVKYGATSYKILRLSTIIDKILGTNLHLWRFFSGYTCSAPPLPPPPPHPRTMLDTCTCYFSRVSTLYWGGGREATHFETDNSAFLRLRFKSTEN